MKNFRRIFSLLLTAVMLFSLLPEAMATGGNVLGGNTFQPVCNHIWDYRWPNGEPQNCVTPGTVQEYCILCGAVGSSFTAYGDHSVGYWMWDGDAPSNCTQEGVVNGYCRYCNEPVDERSEYGPHNWATKTTQQPTCTGTGSKQSVCTFCGSRSGKAEVIPALGHDWTSWEWEKGSPTCTQGAWRIRTCKRCRLREDQWVDAGNHNWGPETIISEGTCVKPGRARVTCTICGATNERDTSYGSHSWGDWKVDKAGTCIEPGTEKRTCVLCGEIQTRNTEARNHRFGEWLPGEASTCTKQGNEYQVCSRCGEKNWRHAPLADHVFGEWYVLIAPQVDVTGLEERACTFGCGLTEQREIPALSEGSHYSAIDLEIVNLPSAVGVDPGDALTARVKVTNTGDTTLNLSSFAFTGGDGGKYYNALVNSWNAYSSSPRADWFIPGATLTTDLEFIVTKESIDAGELHFTFTQFGVPYYAEMNGVLTNITTNGSDMPDGVENWRGKTEETVSDSVVIAVPVSSTKGITGEVTLVTTVTSTPANGSYYVPGESVIYRLDMTNNTNSNLREVAIDFEGLTLATATDEIAVGECYVFWFNYHVTEYHASRGYIGCQYNGTWVFTENGESGSGVSNYVEVPCGLDVQPDDGALTVVLAEETAPENGTYYIDRENIFLLITVGNTFAGKSLSPVSENIDSSGSVYSFSQYAYALQPNGERAFKYVHRVSQEDVARGYIDFTYTAVYQDAEGNQYTGVDTLQVPCGEEHNDDGNITDTDIVPGTDDDGIPNENDTDFSGTTIPDGGMSSALSIIKRVISTPANGAYYVPGEAIQYELTVTNTSATALFDVTIADSLLNGNFGQKNRLEPGESFTETGVYVATDLDAMDGSVTNAAYANAFDAEGNQHVEYCTPVTVPCGFPEGGMDIPFGVLTGLEIEKTEVSLPLNGKYYEIGEVIHYLITYTNIGELQMIDVEVFDLLDGVHAIASAEKLDPGESRICTYEHTVTLADVEAGYVCNTATASFDVNGIVGSAVSNTVYSNTNKGVAYDGGELPKYDGAYSPSVTPVLPMPPKAPKLPKWTPDEGWCIVGTVPPAAAGDSLYYTVYETVTGTSGGSGTSGSSGTTGGSSTTEGSSTPTLDSSYFGTIDTGALYDNNSCVRTITGRDSASASYETSFCADHVGTQSSVLMMNQVSATPEMQMQAAAYAVVLWRTEVENLYQKIYSVSDAQAQAIVLTEYVRFLTDMANYEAMLKVLHPDEPALVARTIAAMWQDKCVTLCYEMHTPASERKDSLLSVEAAIGALADVCACVTVGEESGKQSITQTYCAVHGFPFSMIDMLLKGNDTAEAWIMVRQIWGVELTSIYNKLAAKLGDSNLIAKAEHATLTQWMMAREASLLALYPENPELVAQTMVKTIMERVSQLCSLLP